MLLLKVDKGFELIYKNLSYRRKVIRTLWTIVIGNLVYGLFYLLGTTKLITITYGIFMIIFIIQLVYNYLKWQ